MNTTIDWTVVTDWITENEWAAPVAGTALILIIIMVAAVRRGAARRLPRVREIKPKTPVGKRLALTVVAFVTIGTFGLSFEGMLGFFENVLGITNEIERYLLAGVFDGAAVAFAIVAHMRRKANPHTVGMDSVWVWVCAILSGAFAATQVEALAGQAARMVPPLLCALLFDRLIQLDLSLSTGIDRAKVQTITTAIIGGVRGVLRRGYASWCRYATKRGWMHPDNTDLTTLSHERWERSIVRAYAEHNAKPTDRTGRTVKRLTAEGIIRGAIRSPEDSDRIKALAAIIEDALSPRTGPDRTDNDGPDDPDRTATKPDHRTETTDRTGPAKPRTATDRTGIVRPKPVQTATADRAAVFRSCLLARFPVQSAEDRTDYTVQRPSYDAIRADMARAGISVGKGTVIRLAKKYGIDGATMRRSQIDTTIATTNLLSSTTRTGQDGTGQEQ